METLANAMQAPLAGALPHFHFRAVLHYKQFRAIAFFRAEAALSEAFLGRFKAFLRRFLGVFRGKNSYNETFVVK